MVLTSCSSSKAIILDTGDKVINYLIAHQQTGQEFVSFTFSLGGSGERVLDNPSDYLNHVLPLYNEQAFINGIIYEIYTDDKGGNLYIKIDGNTIYAREADEYTRLWEIKHFNTLADFSFKETDRKRSVITKSNDFINNGVTPVADSGDIVYMPNSGVATRETSYITMNLLFGESSMEYTFYQSHYDFLNFTFPEPLF